MDGGKAGLGATVHAIAEKVQEEDTPQAVHDSMSRSVQGAEGEKPEHFFPTPNGTRKTENEEETEKARTQKPEHFSLTPNGAPAKEGSVEGEGIPGKMTPQEKEGEDEEDELLRSLAITRNKSRRGTSSLMRF